MFLYHWTFENETIQFFLLLLGVLSLHDLSHSSTGIQELLQRKCGLLVPWFVQGQEEILSPLYRSGSVHRVTVLVISDHPSLHALDTVQSVDDVGHFLEVYLTVII